MGMKYVESFTVTVEGGTVRVLRWCGTWIAQVPDTHPANHAEADRVRLYRAAIEEAKKI